MAINSRPGGANVPPFDSVADPRKFVILRDDFIGNLGGTRDDTHAGLSELGWLVTDIAGSADSDVDIITTASIVSGHPGVVQLNTGPTTPAAGDEAGLTLPGAVVLPDGDGMIYMAAAVRFPSVTSVEFNFGLFDLSLAAGRDSDSVSIELDVSADTEFRGVSVAGSSVVDAEVVSTVTAAANTWYSLELAADANSAYFWIDGEMVGSAHGTMTALPLHPGFKVATEAAAEKSVQIDFAAIRMPASR